MLTVTNRGWDGIGDYQSFLYIFYSLHFVFIFAWVAFTILGYRDALHPIYWASFYTQLVLHTRERKGRAGAPSQHIEHQLQADQFITIFASHSSMYQLARTSTSK